MRSSILVLVLAVILSIMAPLISSAAASVSVKATVSTPHAVKITDLSYSPKPYNPTKGCVRVSFMLSKAATVVITITDKCGAVINMLGPYRCSQGHNSIYWDGKNSAGHLVDPSWYSCSVFAKDSTTSDLKTIIIAVSYGKPLIICSLGAKPRCFRPPAETTKFIVYITRDARIRLVIEAKNGSVVKSTSYLFQHKGRRSFVWNGTDNQGRVVKPGKYVYKITGKDSGDSQATISDMIRVLPPKKPLLYLFFWKQSISLPTDI